jgi:YidC/Oxa1 family membrane protein insertase
MEKRALLAFILSLAVLFLWEVFSPSESSWFKRLTMQPSPQVQSQPSSQEKPSPPPAPSQPSAPEALPSSVPASPKTLQERWTITTPLYQTQVVSSGARLDFFRLTHYRQEVNPDSPPMELIPTQASGYLPLAVDLLHHPDWELATRPYRCDAPQTVRVASGGSPQGLDFSSEVANRLRVTKTFTFTPDRYTVDVTLRLHNLGAEPLADQAAISFYFQPYTSITQESSYNKSQFVVFHDNSLKTLDLKEIAKKEQQFGPSLQWAGYENNYFIQALIPMDQSGFQLAPRVLDEATGLMRAVYLTDAFQLDPGQEKTFVLRLYLGPKDLGALKEAGHQLSNALDYGWFDFLAKPLLYALKWFYKYTHNYGVAIILITVIIKIIFWPLTHKSYKSMQGMKKLQPKMAKIREKYKDDREKLNEELMALYRTYKVNPLGGCLPMVLQIPVFFALYRMLYSSVDLLHQPFMLWINDLTAPDRLSIGFPIPYLGNGLPILTLLMGASMFIQQKMTPSTGDPRQEKMMLMMPVIFTVMFINFPSGLVLYWLVNNVLSIAQQYWINRHV